MTDEELIERIALIARHAHACSNGWNHGGVERAEQYWRLAAPEYKQHWRAVAEAVLVELGQIPPASADHG